MSLQIQSIIRAALRESESPLNIICVDAPERYLLNLAKTNHNFYIIGNRWDHRVLPMPENVKELFFIESSLEADLVISFGRNRNFKNAASIANKLHLPLILNELDAPNPNRDIKKVQGDVNIFMSDLQAKAWGAKKNYIRIHNSIDIDLYGSVDTELERKKQVLTAIPYWKERDWSHGFRLYFKHLKDINLVTLGQNRFVHWQELIKEYNDSEIYFNPTLCVPHPSQILEAFASNCLVISFDTPYNRELITHGVNGFLTTPEHAVETLEKALNLNWEAKFPILLNAVDTLTEKFSLSNFIKKWQEVLIKAAQMPYIGGNYES